MQLTGERSPTATMLVLLVGGLLVVGCGTADGGEPDSMPPQRLAELCAEDQLSDRHAAEDALAALVEEAGYEPGPLDAHIAILDEGCEEMDVLGLEVSFRVGAETVRLIWDGPERLSSDRPEPTAPPLTLGDVTIRRADDGPLGPMLWFACGESQVTFFHDVFVSDDLADDPRARMHVDPWDGDAELITEVVRDVAEAVVCPAGILVGEG